MLTLLVGLAHAAAPCPDALETVKEQRAAVTEARRVAHRTNWDYYLAVDDRDEVLARQAEALETLRSQRLELREAKRQLRAIERAPATELVCEPAEAPTTT